jgi:tRNA pseudouridine38/39 synthase
MEADVLLSMAHLKVRCMAAVLMMVGRGLEPPSVVAKYLDVSTEPRKPQYAMASEVTEDTTA